MKKFLILLFVIVIQMNSSTINNLKITDDDFIKILYSSKKNYILDRINDLILLRKSMEKVDDVFTKLNAVNDFFNEFEYEEDIVVYKRADYWATRKEFILTGRGDCEDFAIAKYFTLVEMGIDESKLSLLHNLRMNEYHMVLAYQEDQFSDVLILDSLVKKIIPLTSRHDILVLYTLKQIDLTNTTNITQNMQNLVDYKWSEVYFKTKN